MSIGQGTALSVRLTSYFMIPLAEELTILNDNGTDRRIRAGKTQSETSEFQGSLHPLRILLLHGWYCNRHWAAVKARL
jgi:hypothetical protein